MVLPKAHFVSQQDPGCNTVGHSLAICSYARWLGAGHTGQASKRVNFAECGSNDEAFISAD